MEIGTILKKFKKKEDFRPARDWKIIIIFFFIVNFFMMGLSLYVFAKMSRGEFFADSSEINSNLKKIDLSPSQDVINYYSDRQEKLNQLNIKYSGAIDPSL